MHSNKKFKAKRMRDDLVFVKESEKKSSDFTAAQRKVFKELDGMESSWTKQQEEEYKRKVTKSMEKEPQRNDYINLLLGQCKAHGGPITDESDLKRVVQAYGKNKAALKSGKVDSYFSNVTFSSTNIFMLHLHPCLASQSNVRR